MAYGDKIYLDVFLSVVWVWQKFVNKQVMRRKVSTDADIDTMGQYELNTNALISSSFSCASNMILSHFIRLEKNTDIEGFLQEMKRRSICTRTSREVNLEWKWSC
jgi:hypothetical protein